MNTPLHYLSLRLEKPAVACDWIEFVEQSLLKEGQPIRWAITAVESAWIEVEVVVQRQQD